MIRQSTLIAALALVCWAMLGCGEDRIVEVVRTVTVPVEVVKTETVEVPVERVVTKTVFVEVEKAVTQVVHESEGYRVLPLQEYIPKTIEHSRWVRHGRGPEVVDIVLPKDEEFTVEVSFMEESPEVITSLASGAFGITVARWPTIHFTSSSSGSSRNFALGTGAVTSSLDNTYIGNNKFAIYGASGTVNVLIVTRSDWEITFTRTK